jgi:hypothetical protein
MDITLLQRNSLDGRVNFKVQQGTQIIESYNTNCYLRLTEGVKSPLVGVYQNKAKNISYKGNVYQMDGHIYNDRREILGDFIDDDYPDKMNLDKLEEQHLHFFKSVLDRQEAYDFLKNLTDGWHREKQPTVFRYSVLTKQWLILGDGINGERHTTIKTDSDYDIRFIADARNFKRALKFFDSKQVIIWHKNHHGTSTRPIIITDNKTSFTSGKTAVLGVFR